MSLNRNANGTAPWLRKQELHIVRSHEQPSASPIHVLILLETTHA